MTTMEWVMVVGAIAVVVLAVLAVFAAKGRRMRRHEHLQRQFGPEYERVVEKIGSERAADRVLAGRLDRVERFELRTVPSEEQRGFRQRWYQIQQRFVDSPEAAVREAHELVLEVMRALGYPDADVVQRVDDVSVHHPEVADNFRSAAEVARNVRSGTVSTDDMRQAVIHYRALFDELLEPPVTPRAASRPRGEARPSAR
jgi:hypothetical protein